MERVKKISPDQAVGEVKRMYEAMQKRLGLVPNMVQAMANSPAALKGYQSLSAAVGSSSLDPRLGEKIALLLAELNHCHYCLAAHTAISQNLGLTVAETLSARQGQDPDPKTAAILQFCRLVVEKNARVSADEVRALKTAGVSDQELVDIILAITLSLYTNYFNNIVAPESEFPPAPERE